ncbi:MAG: hypothetical protein R8K46_10825 [Mariprofundaceae bacterium]
MTKVLIKVNVAYPRRFITTFENQSTDRRSKGELQYSHGVDEDCRNFVHVISDWESINSAKKFWVSTEAKKQINDWNVVDSPEITILREGSED